MQKRYLIVIGLVVVLAGAAGCANTQYSRGPMVLGDSFLAARNNQILNPEAWKNLEPPRGLGGWTAEIVMDKYRKDFEKKQGPNVYAISIGGIGSVGGR